MDNKNMLQQALTVLDDRIHNDLNSKVSDDQAMVLVWQVNLADSKELGVKIVQEISKVQDLEITVEKTNQVLTEYSDKYRLKDKLFKQCIDSQRQKQAKIDNLKRNTETLERKFKAVEH